jgi:serine/threonine protein phosphatase 1
MASIAIGDIHGNLAALGDLLAQIEPTLTAQDTVVFLGDYIDRGTHSAQVVDRILALRRKSPATVVTLKGNHEVRLVLRHLAILWFMGITTMLKYEMGGHSRV